tara:strand:+ start:61 stop:666 length:606 start_codon:yes stop_codon:yes gene_type:complete
MKKLCIYLFIVLFSLQTSSQADDIRDFQIEGMSIGDSLLDYFSKDELDNFEDPYKNIVPNKKVKTFILESKLEIYDMLELTYFENDKKYIIHGLGGAIFFPDNIKDCKNKQGEVLNNLKAIFDNSDTVYNKFKFPADKSGKSKMYQYSMMITPNSKYYNIMINCFEFGKEFKSRSFVNNLNIIINSEKINDYFHSVGLGSK